MRSFQFTFSSQIGPPEHGLSFSTRVILLVFGLSLLLIHLGDARVLTRHEVLAAQPAREMLQDGTFADWMLPKLAGLPREAKPPGMMWLIALSMYIFRSDAEWVARLPSALAGFSVAWMIARLAARWFDGRIGRLAGLLQLTFLYLLTQAKLSEADMMLTAMVCSALCCFAVAVIDSPVGLDRRRRTQTTFWLAAGASFLLKGPIGPLFIGLAIAAFAVVRRMRPHRLRDWRIPAFLADPVGIACFVVLVAAWPLLAWHYDPSILHSWNSAVVGSATGQNGSEPFYFYVFSVPFVLLPWTPFVAIGLLRGPTAELTGSVNEQIDRVLFWRFLLCWFAAGIAFLSFGMKLKSHHYSDPILPPLTIPAAIGFDYFVRRQTSHKQPLVWPFFLGGCIVAALVVRNLPQVPADMKHPIILLIEIFAAGGLCVLHWERAHRPGLAKFAYFATAWAIAVGVQAWAMPVQDDFRFQTDFARAVNSRVPPGATIYMLGHREEEQEAQYAYYLRFPMQRLRTSAEFYPKVRYADGEPVYAIAPAGLLPELNGIGRIETVLSCAGLRKGETESNRLRLLRIRGGGGDD
jgi:4-amino-4-deoxy-L-arabinose transferase-like glycosyltransferase